MSPTELAGVIIAVTVVSWLGLLVLLRTTSPATVGSGSSGSLAARRRRGARGDAAGVTRRQFLNRAYLAAVLVALANFALASLDYLWPRSGGGLGSKITVGDAQTLLNTLATTRDPIFNSDGFFFLMTYEGRPAAASRVPAYEAANTAATGFVALFRRCVHLGCSVPFCNTSKWFECPCHGSKYSINGEYRAGPAPRGLDRFRVDISNGKVVVDTTNLITGPPRGTVTSQPQPEGVHCVTISGA
ncbi:MAG TPA: ubiquinol-cytochrome c reductase iron-sulfur subunit [Actinomycetota bacterium]|jgi:cytochrome b6-f complex iron-sulfur subunit